MIKQQRYEESSKFKVQSYKTHKVRYLDEGNNICEVKCYAMLVTKDFTYCWTIDKGLVTFRTGSKRFEAVHPVNIPMVTYTNLRLMYEWETNGN